MRQRIRYLLSWPVLIALLLCAAWTGDGAELVVKCGAEALNVWDDAASGAAHHVTFYLAPTQGAYHPVGVTADEKERGERSTLCLVRDISTNGDALAQPVDYDRIWWDRGSGAIRDGAIWKPRCPENYVGVGFMVQASYRKPARDAIRCVREDLTVPGAAAVRPAGPDQLGSAVHKDFGTRAIQDLSVWRVMADDGFDVGAVFAWDTRTMPKEKDGVRLLQKAKVRVTTISTPITKGEKR